MYTIKALVSGLRKSGIIENGEVGIRKTVAGEILNVQDVARSEMEAGYYLIVKRKLAAPDGQIIKRETVPAPVPTPEPVEDKAVTKKDLLRQQIAAAQEVMDTAISALREMDAEEEPEIVPPPPREPKPALILDSKGDVPEEFMIDEDEATSEVYDEAAYRQGNAAYDNVMKNTVLHYMGGPNSNVFNVDKIGKMANKPLPTVSQARKGRQIGVKVTKADMAQTKGLGKSVKINTIMDANGKVDVRKTLNLQLINKPGEGFNL